MSKSKEYFTVHRTSSNGYNTMCGKKVGEIKYDRLQGVITKPHTVDKKISIFENNHKVLCDECWETYKDEPDYLWPETICKW